MRGTRPGRPAPKGAEDPQAANGGAKRHIGRSGHKGSVKRPKSHAQARQEVIAAKRRPRTGSRFDPAKLEVADGSRSKTATTVGAACRRRRRQIYVGLDVHRDTIQVAAIDSARRMIINKKIKNTFGVVRSELDGMPSSAKYVMESSSVWYALFRFMSDDLGMDVVLSDPYQTSLIAKSKKKTDKVDAAALAMLLESELIVPCHVPDRPTVHARRLLRHRASIVHDSTRLRNRIRGIQLQGGIRIRGKWGSQEFHRQLRAVGDPRIGDNLDAIEFHGTRIRKADAEIEDLGRASADARLLRTVPGVGPITSLAVAVEIDGIERFPDSGRLKSYFGMTTSVRGSAETVHYGRITKMGNSMVRHLLAEAVLIHARYRPDSPISKFHARLKKRRGHSKAKVAAACKLLVYMDGMLRRRMGFSEFVSAGDAKRRELRKKRAAAGRGR